MSGPLGKDRLLSDSRKRPPPARTRPQNLRILGCRLWEVRLYSKSLQQQITWPAVGACFGDFTDDGGCCCCCCCCCCCRVSTCWSCCWSCNCCFCSSICCCCSCNWSSYSRQYNRYTASSSAEKFPDTPDTSEKDLIQKPKGSVTAAWLAQLGERRSAEGIAGRGFKALPLLDQHSESLYNWEVLPF